MSFFEILETLFIGPLKLIFEIIYNLAYRFVGNPGLSIIFLSLVMNILVLPLYRQADAMQEASRDIENKLSKGVAHIKKTFSGDERMMILQTYYRQNHYKPTDALHGSVSLLLEIPFFMAAYQFLSHLEILNGTSFGPIKDLSLPDGLITIGDFSINLLPILMTAVNVISSALYLKGFPMKTKVQLYAMAGFFLVFLYTSPAGLVFYWTLNNVFSLVKTIFYKIKNPQKVLRILTAIIGVTSIIFVGFIYDNPSTKKKIFLIGLGIILLVPLFMPIIKKAVAGKFKAVEAKPNRKFFVAGAMYLTVLVGLLIPTTFISASPQEFVDVTYFHNPLWYVVSAACLAAGTFLVWMSVFYWLANPKGKVIFEALVGIMCVAMTINYMFFGTKLGNISSTLQYDDGMSFALKEQLINLAVIGIIALVVYFLIKNWKSTVASILIIAFLALTGMSVFHINTIKTSVNRISAESLESGEMPTFTLSKTGDNVVVLMIDRFMSIYLPYILNERPDVAQQFEGFTYYSNTISHGSRTNFGTPAVFGGYEYTPVEMNKRNTESLASKQTEAVKVMPSIFWQNGYDVTIFDPTYINYDFVPDFSVYEDYPGIDAYVTKGAFSSVKQKETVISNNHRNFFSFSIMKTMPLFMQTNIYDNGNYLQIRTKSEEVVSSVQTADTPSTAVGVNSLFMQAYNVLENMSNITKITEEDKNTFLMMTNDTTHDPMLLQMPECVPSATVDNTEYDKNYAGSYVVNGVELKMETTKQRAHYQSHMAACIQLGKWFDYLRENDVFDNTKIIIVADHGHNLLQMESLTFATGDDYRKDIEFYYPVLLVKDFNSKEFTVSSEFMTNADVPTLAMNGLIDNPINPFTGKPINNNEKTAHDQIVILSELWDIKVNNGNTFKPSKWASVKDNLWDKNNWTFYDEEIVLDEHKLPSSNR